MSTTPEPAGYETDFDAIRANLRQFAKDTDYIQAQWEEWREKYPDHYVLVYDEKLISASTDLREAIRLAESQGVRPGHAARAFFSTDTDDLILGSWLKSVCNRRENSPSNVAIPPTTCLAALHAPSQTGPVLSERWHSKLLKLELPAPNHAGARQQLRNNSLPTKFRSSILWNHFANRNHQFVNGTLTTALALQSNTAA